MTGGIGIFLPGNPTWRCFVRLLSRSSPPSSLRGTTTDARLAIPSETKQETEKNAGIDRSWDIFLAKLNGKFGATASRDKSRISRSVGGPFETGDGVKTGRKEDEREIKGGSEAPPIKLRTLCPGRRAADFRDTIFNESGNGISRYS